MKTELYILTLSGIVGFALAGRADSITSIKSDQWDLGTTWSDGQVPVNTNDYVVPNGFVINTPNIASGTVTRSFTGASLTVGAGGRLELWEKHSSTVTGNYTVTNLLVASGSLRAQAQTGTSTYNVNSPVAFSGSSAVECRGGSYTVDLRFNQGISGSGAIAFSTDRSGNSGTGERAHLRVYGTNNAYSGNWTVRGYDVTAQNEHANLWANAPGALGTGTVTLNDHARLYCNATGALDMLAGIILAATSSQLTLTQPWSNTTAFVSAVGGATIELTSGSSVVGKMVVGSTPVPPGIYTETDLVNNYGLNSPLTGAGTLEVKTLYVNNAPSFTSNPLVFPDATQSTAYSNTLAGSVTDPDPSDTQTFSKLTGPAWLTVAANGALSGSPANPDVGTNVWTVRVTDSGGLTADATLQIYVVDVNDPPIFTVNPLVLPNLNPGDAVTGSLFYYSTDPDAGDTRTFAKLSGPAWLSVAANGNLSGAPSASDSGTNLFTVKVQDAAGATNTGTLQITVGMLSSITSITNGAWNDTNTWSDLLLPTADKNYVVDGETVDSPLLTASGSQSFSGNRLTVSNGVLRLRLEHNSSGETANYTIPGLTVAGGALRGNATTGNTTWNVNSPVAFSGNSQVQTRGGSYTTDLRLNQGISGSGNLDFSTDRSGNAGTGERAHLRIYGASNPFSGSWTVRSLDTTGEHANLWANDAGALGTGVVALEVRGSLYGNAAKALDTLAGIYINDTYSQVVLTYPYVNSNGFVSVVAGCILDVGNSTSVVDSMGLNGAPVAAGIYDNSALTGLGLTPNWASLGALVVRHAYNAPVFTTSLIDRGNTAEDAPFSGTIAGLATDSDPGDTLTYSKRSGPAWLTVAANGALAGTPLQADVGTSTFTVRAADSHGLYAETTLQITVTNVNDAPVFTANPIIDGKDKDYSLLTGSLAGFATDEDLAVGDVLTFSKLSGPGWLTLGTDGSYSGTPTAANNGSNVFTVAVTDLAGAATNASLIMWVGPITTTITSVTNGLLTAATTWSDSQPPFTYYAYLIDGETVSSPNANGTYSFAGDSLTVQSGVLRLPLQSGSALTGNYNYTNLALGGGTLECAASQNSSTWNLNQPLAVSAPSTLAQTGGTNSYTINLNGGLIGAGSLTFVVDRNDTNNINSTLNVYGNNTNFSGNWTVASLDAAGGAQVVAQAAGALGSGVVTLGNGGKLSTTYYDGIASGLDGVAGILVAGTNAQLTLTYPWNGSNAFLSLTTNASLDLGYAQIVVRSLATNGSPMPAGTYYASDLLLLGFNAMNYGPLVVLNAYHQPAFAANPTLAAEAKAGETYSASLAGKVTDADAGDAFTFTKLNGPAWLNVAANGALSGTPATRDSGNNSFSVRVMDSHGLYSDGTVQVMVTAVAAPLADFIGTPSSGVRPLSVTFASSSSGSITNLVWNFGDGSAVVTTASNATPAHLYTVEGVYPVTLIAQGAGGSATNTRSGYISVAAPGVPRVVLFKGAPSALTIQGEGGPVVAGQTYYYVLHSSTDLASPKASWRAVATNAFNLDGSFSNTIPVTPGEPKRFYHLQMP